MPRKVLSSAAAGRRNGSDGALRLRPPARRTPPRRASSSRWRESPPCRAGRDSPPAGRSGRSRLPSAAPASRRLDHPPAPPHAANGRRLVGTDIPEVARRDRRRPVGRACREASRFRLGAGSGARRAVCSRAGERSAGSTTVDSPYPPFTASRSALAALNDGTVGGRYRHRLAGARVPSPCPRRALRAAGPPPPG